MLLRHPKWVRFELTTKGPPLEEVRAWPFLRVPVASARAWSAQVRAAAWRSVLLRPVEPAQYTALTYTDKLALDGIAPSIGSVGDAYDNALMETINGIYKAECIRTTIFHDGPYKTIADVEYATAGWVDWYNQRRLHGSPGTISPIEFENAHYATSPTLNREPQPV